MKNKFLCGLLSLVMAGTLSCANTKPYQVTNFGQRINYDNESKIQDDHLERIGNGVELLTVDRMYCSDDDCDFSQRFGTGFVYKKGTTEDYLLTAGHVITPGKSFFNTHNGKLYELIDFKVTISDKNIELEEIVSELNEEFAEDIEAIEKFFSLSLNHSFKKAE